MPALEDLPLDELRAMRTTARRSLELARMRARTDDQAAMAEIERLRLAVEVSTEELIRRYEGDLSLVDRLLGAPYAQSTSRREAGGK